MALIPQIHYGGFYSGQSRSNIMYVRLSSSSLSSCCCVIIKFHNLIDIALLSNHKIKQNLLLLIWMRQKLWEREKKHVFMPIFSSSSIFSIFRRIHWTFWIYDKNFPWGLITIGKEVDFGVIIMLWPMMMMILKNRRFYRWIFHHHHHNEFYVVS